MKKYLDPNCPFSPKKIDFFYGWVVIAFLIFMGGLGAIGRTPVIGPFVSDLSKVLNITSANMCVTYTFGSIVSGLLLPFIGRSLERFHIRVVAPVILICLSLVLLYLCQLKNIEQYIRYPFVLMTIGFVSLRLISQTLDRLIPRTVVAIWFKRKRVFASACTAASISIICSLLPLMSVKLGEIFEWRALWMIIGIATIIFATPLAWVILRKSPQECELEVDGDDIESSNFSNEKKDRHSKEASSDKDDHLHNLNPHEIQSWLRKKLKNYQFLFSGTFWAFNLVFGAQALLGSGIAFHFGSIGLEAGVDKKDMFFLLIPTAFLDIFFNFFVSIFLKKLHLRTLFIIFVSFMISTIICLTNINHKTFYILFPFIYSMSWSLNNMLLFTAWPAVFGTKMLGSINGCVLGFASISSAFGALLIGLSMEYLGSFSKGLASFCIFLICLIIPLVFVKNKKIT